jgi:hypothetical protein
LDLLLLTLASARKAFTLKWLMAKRYVARMLAKSTIAVLEFALISLETTLARAPVVITSERRMVQKHACQ